MIGKLTIIVLTFNEEKRIQRVLDSVKSLTANILVVDSFSNDSTLKILQKNKICYVQNPFENYAKQRNWAQVNDPFCGEWVMHLDADEPITDELASWIRSDFPEMSKKFDGFLFSRKTYFLGRWIKNGGQYPNFHLRLYKKVLGKCEEKAYDQHFVLEGGNLKIMHGLDIYNTVADSIDDLILTHNKWSSLEAEEIHNGGKDKGEVTERFFGNPIERRRWMKNNIFQKSPLFIRAFCFFIYRYIIKLGFLDGKEGLIFFVLQTFWFRFLVDAKVHEARISRKVV